MSRIITLTLKMLGVYEWGYRNHLDLQVVRRRLILPNLPKAFDGYKVLHLSDTHIDLDPNLALTEAIIKVVAPLEYNVCVLTGDFLAGIGGDHSVAMRETAKLIQHIQAPTFAVLGNHDTVEIAAPLEEMGVKVLLH